MATVRSWLLALVVALPLAACAAAEEVVTASTTVVAALPTTTSEPVPSTTSTTRAALPPCGQPGFVPTLLPATVAPQQPAPGDVGLDRFTLLPGTAALFWVDAAGDPVVVLARGTLPPEPFTGPRAPLQVRGFDAVIGPLADEVWAVAWLEGEGRCDQYSLFFYPPTTPQEAVAVAESIPSP